MMTHPHSKIATAVGGWLVVGRLPGCCIDGITRQR
jgi:hypothetical protein